MEDNLLFHCICKVAKRFVNSDNINDWILVLSDNGLLTKGQRNSLRNLAKTKSIEVILLKCCEHINNCKDKDEKLSEAFREEEFPGDEKSAQIIQQLFKDGGISNSVAWIIESWDALQASDALRAKAEGLCPGISQDDWPLDFIHHLLITGNSYAVDNFVKNARKVLGDKVTLPEHASSTEPKEPEEKMDVDSTDAHRDERMSFCSQTSDTAQSYVDVSVPFSTMPPSEFATLNSDGEMTDEEAGGSTEDHERAESIHIDRTTEEIRQEVQPFEMISMEWENVDEPTVEEEASVRSSKKPDEMVSALQSPLLAWPEHDPSLTSNPEKQRDLGSVSNKSLPLKKATELQKQNDSEPRYKKATEQTFSAQERSANWTSEANEESNNASSIPQRNAGVPDQEKKMLSTLQISVRSSPEHGQSLTSDLDKRIDLCSMSAQSLPLKNSTEMQHRNDTAPHSKDTTEAAEQTFSTEGNTHATVAQVAEEGRNLNERKDKESTLADTAAATNELTETTMKIAGETKHMKEHCEMKNSLTDKSNESETKADVPALAFADTAEENSRNFEMPMIKETKKDSGDNLKMTGLKDKARQISTGDEVMKDLHHPLSRSSSETSTSSEEGSESLDWFSGAIKEIRRFKFNLFFITKLAWPEEDRLLEKWPLTLITWLQQQIKDEKEKVSVETFIDVCKTIVETTEPMKVEYERIFKKEQGKLWFRENSDILSGYSRFMLLLHRLLWPTERVEEDGVVDSVFMKTHKSQRPQLNSFCDAMKTYLDNARKDQILKFEQQDHAADAEDQKVTDANETKSSSNNSGMVLSTLHLPFREQPEHEQSLIKDPMERTDLGARRFHSIPLKKATILKQPNNNESCAGNSTKTDSRMTDNSSSQNSKVTGAGGVENGKKQLQKLEKKPKVNNSGRPKPAEAENSMAPMDIAKKTQDLLQKSREMSKLEDSAEQISTGGDKTKEREQRLSSSSSETSIPSEEKPNLQEGTDWFSASVERIKQYEFNLCILTNLTWPQQKRLLEKWPVNLLNWLQQHEKEQPELVETFIDACKKIIETNEPMKVPYKREFENGTAWLRSNSDLLRRSIEYMLLIHQLVWPAERVEADDILENVFSKTSRNQKARLNKFCDAMKVFLDNSQKDLPPQFEQQKETTRLKIKKKSKDLKQKQVGPKSGESTAKKMRALLGFGRKDKPINEIQGGDNDQPIKEQDQKIGQKSSLEMGNKSGQKTLSHTHESLKPTVKNVDDVQAEQTEEDSDGQFHDAIADLDESIVLKKPTSDHSFELRVVYVETDPSITTMYVKESCWYKWQSLKMEYNRERNFYFVSLPLPETKFTMHYKYYVHVEGRGSVWEVLPSQYKQITNREVVLEKGVEYVHDVPTFVFGYAEHVYVNNAIKKYFHIHFPTVKKVASEDAGSGMEEKQSYFSLKKEICSCVSQLKRGWRTTDTLYHSQVLVTQDIDLIALKWLSIAQSEVRNETERLALILAVLNLAIALHKTNHRIFEGKFLSTLCSELSVHHMTAKHQKTMYQLIKEEFGSNERKSYFLVCETLLGIYMQLKTVVSSSSPWMDWILTLPLYWLVANDGELKTKFQSPRKGRSMLYMKSALPEFEKSSWSEIRTKSKSVSCQRALISLAEKVQQIHSIHPWITGTYMYLLTEQSLVQMLREKEKYGITEFFDMDSVFYMIMRDWRTDSIKREAFSDAILVEKYIDMRIENITKSDGKRLQDEERDIQKTSAKNILDLSLKIANDFLSSDAYCGHKNRNVLFLVKMTHFPAEWMFHIQDEDESYDEVTAKVTVILSVVCEKISKLLSMREDDMKFVNSMLEISWSDKQTQDIWVRKISQHTATRLRMKWCRLKEDFLDFYVKTVDEQHLNKNLEKCIEEYAFECTEDLLADIDKMRQSSWYSNWFVEGVSLPRFAKLLGKLFQKEYDKIFNSQVSKKMRGLMDCLLFIGKWSFAAQFYEIFCQDNTRGSLAPDVQLKTCQVEKDFRQAVTLFCAGRMKISECEFFITHEKAILEFYGVLQSRNNGTGNTSVDDPLVVNLSVRKSQLQAIAVTKRSLDTFISLCMDLENAGFEVSVSDVDKFPVMNDGMIYNIIDPNQNVENPGTGLEELKHIPSDQMREIQIMNQIYASRTFKKVWKEATIEEREKSKDVDMYTWSEVLGQLWPTAKERARSILCAIYNGSIAVSLLAELFSFTKGDRSTISEELALLAAADELKGLKQFDDTLKERCQQINKILHLKKSERTACLLMNLNKVLNLEGNFHFIEVMQKMEENEDVELNDVNLNVGDSFTDEIWTDAALVQLLETFVEQTELITWLKREMKDRSEVKVFCDLGMISAGETSYEVDRVSFLLSAVMGFAPLIFDLTKKAGLEELIEKCKAVRENARSDDKLEEKWHDTGRQLAWFKGIHKFHGSVGTQSLTLAQDINRHGIYLISKPREGTPTIENSLELTVKMKGKGKAAKHTSRMSYNDLKDLQSKLMLIAGEAEQGQQDVARFNDVLSAAANLTQGYISLINEGCMLFSNWSSKIMCKKGELVISLNFSEDSQPISTTSCLKDLELLVTVMNEARIKWTEYLEKMRLQYYYLNDYNVQQITYLCEKLAKSDFTDQVYSLLSDLKTHQVCHHLQDALEEATEINDEEEIAIEENPGDENETLSNLEIKRRMVRQLAKNGLQENVAKAAVQCEENNDVDDCENWALLHQYEEELISELSKDFDEESGFGPESNTAKNFTSLLHNRTSITLKELIAQIQEKENFSGDDMKIHSVVKTICFSYNDKTSKLTLQDFLSIGHLGKLLKILREKLGGVKDRINRDLIPPMQAGKANLLLVPSSDMLYTTLSLYIHNKEQPLPNRSEVLVCTENTSEDEAGRFMRRAMLRNPHNEKRLFCMTFAEKLSFNVSAHLETLFSSLSVRDVIDAKYQLVIICSSSHQQHYLVTCFDRSRVELKIATEKEGLSRYVHEKLKILKSGETADSSSILPGHDASVKLITSRRSGVGKSLHVKRLTEQLDDNTHVTTIRLLQREIEVDHVLKRLHRKDGILNEDAHLIHFDLTSAVQHGIEEFMFNLFLLGSIQDSHGRIWRHHSRHFYAIEMTESKLLANSVLNLVPCTTCLSPKDILQRYERVQSTEIDNVILMDQEKFKSEIFQRPYQYLKRYDAKEDLDKFNYSQPAGSEEECIRVLLKHCGMKNPSWAQLHYFSSFLNIQLVNCEQSIFCQSIQGSGRLQDTIEFPGLKAFAVYFMIKMAQDFATPSLRICDESTKDASDALDHYEMRRRWEDEIHPFVFFNEDRTTMTFINVNVNDNGDLLSGDGTTSKHGMISKRLVADLKRQGVPFGVKFNTLSRYGKIAVLFQFMNIPFDPDPKYELTPDKIPFDPDPTYELTTDNVLKMLAIYMRLRCNIPVIIMGETGCGKTRMVEFMSKMRSGKCKEAQNMVTLKVHGGIKATDIYDSVQEAKSIAMQNSESHKLSTILFFDEANTTSAIHAIKEVVCDLTTDGEDFKASQLQIVAACNPYKKLSEAAVKKLEESGLGYNIKASEAEQVGHIPMRRLVYRVVALPPSMQPFVWDFGQLSKEAEEVYIRQMTNRLKSNLCLSDNDAYLISSILFDAQCYMRKKCKDESRYVSLRDVERSLKAFEWFHSLSKHIFPELKEYHTERKDKFEHDTLVDIPCVLRCLLHTLSVCYHASLDDRKSFRRAISQALQQHFVLLSERQINLEIMACQTLFASSLKMDDNIACNEALRENVFLMTVCADLRIPLFVVGKPGSSKSLAKTIVADNMQGKTSHSELYKHFKQVHILSYQCSALTDAQGIESIFNQCAQLQSKQDINSYVAVVVLDEVGLAEDSPNMPLKVLHPLLECGSTKNGTLTEFDLKKKVAFVGISNWALDPAKMNRGIFVTRNSPDGKDLRRTAEGIFENQVNRMRPYKKIIKALTDAYLEIYRRQEKEYFGLRDYYSLIKMLHAKCKISYEISTTDVCNAIQRNFSGGEHDHLERFYEELKYSDPSSSVSVPDMIGQNLIDDKSRFLLLLTNQYSSFSLLQNIIPNFHKTVQVIFGSSFPNDHSYTDMCRNINRVKVCMEAGRTVILLNMTEINESLYDALNQHYVTLGGQRYVDLGLGGHRVKCRIADGFRLIVIELKEKVYQEYPIPLINRLEKHHLTSSSLLSQTEQEIADELKEWIKSFARMSEYDFSESDAFLGHNEDSVSSVVISHKKDLERTKKIILESATTDAVFRLPKTELGSESSDLLKTYIEEQFHESLCKLLKGRLEEDGSAVTLLEITTFSNILSDSDRLQLQIRLNTGQRSVMLLSLQQFQTEQDYLKRLDDFFNFCSKESAQENAINGAILLVQCPQAHKHVQLIACARYGLKNKLSQINNCRRRVIIALLLSTQRKLTSKNGGGEEMGLSLQHSTDCEIIYIDELRPTFRSIGQMSHFHDKTICQVLEIGKNSVHPRNEEDELGINMPTLLQDCICEAMAKIKSKGTEQRILKRIKILTDLCSTDNELSYKFLGVLTAKMVEIYQERETAERYGENWILKEACSAERLQEGGTFAKTLWLCLKGHVSHLLAYIVSIIDRDDNLDIIASKDQKRVHNMWLEMFRACKMNWEDMDGCKEFEIRRKRPEILNGGLRIPFCVFIHQAFEDHWQVINDEAVEDCKKKRIFLKHFMTSNGQMDMAIGNILKLPKPIVIIKAYACDLLKSSYQVSQDTAENLSGALKIISTQLLNEIRSDEEEGEELPGSTMLLLLFWGLKQYERHFGVVNNVIDLCPKAANDMGRWITELEQSNTLMLHRRAIEFALQYGKEKALQIQDAESCIEWMNFTRSLRNIFKSTVDLLESSVDKQQLNRNWEPLAMLDMLLLHLLPNPSQQDMFKRYVRVVASHAKLLYKGTIKNGLRGQQFLRIVCNVLRKYYDDLRLNVILSWQKKTCRICGKDCKLPTILPCGHYFCSSCLRSNFMTSQGKKCFLCATVLPDDYEPLPATLSDVQNGELHVFQSNCTSFFLEYLKQFAFSCGEQNPSATEVFQLLFDEILMDGGAQKTELEKVALDLNLATKCNIFSMMLSYNHSRIEEIINSHLQGSQNTQQLSFTVIKHFELANMRSNNLSTSEEEQLSESLKLLKRLVSKMDKANTQMPVEILKCVAGAHYAITKFVNIISHLPLITDPVERAERDTLLYNIRQVILSDSSGLLREFFVKVGCRTFGMDWFSQIRNNRTYKDLIPDKLKDTAKISVVDSFTSLGSEYSEMRSDLNKTAAGKHTEKVKEWFPAGQQISLEKLLAVSSWIHGHQHCKEAFKSQITSACASSFEVYEVMNFVAMHVWPTVEGVNGFSEQQISLLKQVILVIAGCLKWQTIMTKEFQQLMIDPRKVTHLFWPAMPESFYFSMPEELRCENGQDAMYQCPNGHYYTIGNCTRPWTVSRCPDCRAVIGGIRHAAESGNKRVEKLEETSQAGYKLTSSEKNLQQPEDRISMQAASVLQMVVHACMLIGLIRNPNASTQIIPGIMGPNATEYLLQQIHKNIQDFSNSIGRNSDDTFLVVLKIMQNISKTKVNQESGANSANWNSIDFRKKWEKQFRTIFLLPVFQDLDNIINKAQQNLNSAEDMTAIALFRLVREVKEEEQGPVSTSTNCWENRCLWQIIEHPNAAHLTQCIRDHSRLQTGSVLQTILETPDIDLLQYLEDILKLQLSAIKRYQNKMDLNDTDTFSLKDFQQENAAEIHRVSMYIRVWNKARIQAQNSVECDKLVKDWFDEDLTLNSSIATLLPSTRGHGRCTKILTEYLVEIQNKFLLKCFEICGFNASENEVEVTQLLPSHFVKVDTQNDLMPLIYLHTSHVVSEDAYGRHQQISYNVEALEKQARESFVKNKKTIVLESLPHIKYTQDVGIGTDWVKVMGKTKVQDPLSAKMIQTMDDLVSTLTLAEVCEGVRTLTHAISFLAKVECDHNHLLHEYLETDLLLSKTRTAMIPRFAKIHHTLALYQHLTWHRAVAFVQQGLKPYKESLYQVPQEQITDQKMLDTVRGAFEHMDVILFQQHINEMLIQVPDYDPDWSLAEDILPNLVFLGNEETDDNWFERIPEELCFKHVSHLFELAVNYVQNAL